jgi:hypothetical protein
MQQQCGCYVIHDDTRYIGCSRETANQLPSYPLMQLQLVLQIIQIKKTIFSFSDTDNLQKQTVITTAGKSYTTSHNMKENRMNEYITNN